MPSGSMKSFAPSATTCQASASGKRRFKYRDVQRQGGLADLPGTRQEDHLARQIALDLVGEVAPDVHGVILQSFLPGV